MIWLNTSISKNWNVVFNVVMLLLSDISTTSLTYFQYFISFLIIFFLINLPLYNSTFLNIYLLFPFYFPTTLYLNLTISPFLHLPFILTLLFPIFFTIKICYFLFNSIHILLTQKGEYSLSLYIYIYIYSFFWWMFNSLDWWIFMFNYTLRWNDLVIF